MPDAAWKAKVHADRPEAFPYPDWLPGDSIQSAIGQGDMLVTPLQLANAYATFANGGTLREPRLASEVLTADGKKIRDLAPITRGEVAAARAGRRMLDRLRRAWPRTTRAPPCAVFAGFPKGSVGRQDRHRPGRRASSRRRCSSA